MLKSKSPDGKELLFFMKFKSAPDHMTIIAAMASLLDEKLPWSTPEKAAELLEKSSSLH